MDEKPKWDPVKFGSKNKWALVYEKGSSAIYLAGTEQNLDDKNKFWVVIVTCLHGDHQYFFRVSARWVAAVGWEGLRRLLEALLSITLDLGNPA